MNFATPLLLFLAFLCVGHGLVTFTRLQRVFPGRSAMIWSMAFAIGALGSTMSFGAVQLVH